MTDKRVWALQVSINDYNQWGDYTVALFSKRPSLVALSNACSEGFGDFGYPLVKGLSRTESLERLLKEGSIAEFPATGGGDRWYLYEVEVLNG